MTGVQTCALPIYFGGVIAYAQAKGVGSAIYSPLASGDLTDAAIAGLSPHPLARRRNAGSDAHRQSLKRRSRPQANRRLSASSHRPSALTLRLPRHQFPPAFRPLRNRPRLRHQSPQLNRPKRRPSCRCVPRPPHPSGRPIAKPAFPSGKPARSLTGPPNAARCAATTTNTKTSLTNGRAAMTSGTARLRVAQRAAARPPR